MKISRVAIARPAGWSEEECLDLASEAVAMLSRAPRRTDAFHVQRGCGPITRSGLHRGGHAPSDTVEVVRFDRHVFACCFSAVYWAPERPHAVPVCPVCDPVGVREGDGKALDALARDIIAAGPERVAVLLDVHQDRRPLGRLQHPDDRAEIERLRVENEELRAGVEALGKHFDERVARLQRAAMVDPWLDEGDG